MLNLPVNLTFFGLVVNEIVDRFKYIFFAIGWNIFIKPSLTLLYIIESVREKVSFNYARDLFYGKGQQNFSINKTSILLQHMSIVAILVFLTIFIFNFIKLSLNEKTNTRVENIKKVTKNSIIVFSIIFLLPSLIFFGFNLFEILLDLSLGGSRQSSFNALYYYNSIRPEGLGERVWENMAYRNGDLHFDAPDFKTWRNHKFDSFNFLLVVFMSFLTIFFQLKIIVNIVKIQIETFALIIFSPLVVSTATSNDYSKITILKQKLKTKIFSIYFILFALSMSKFISDRLIETLWNDQTRQSNFLRMLMVFSTTFFISKLSSTLNDFFPKQSFFKSKWISNSFINFKENFKFYTRVTEPIPKDFKLEKRFIRK